MEELMVSVHGRHRRDPLGEEVVLDEVLEHCVRIRSAGQQVAQLGVEPVEYGRDLEELQLVRLQPEEQLLVEVAADIAMSSQLALIDDFRCALPKRVSGEREADSPALRRLEQLADHLLGAVDPVRGVEEGAGLGLGEAEVIAVDLGHLTLGAESVPGQVALVTATHHDAQVVRSASNQILERRPHQRIAQPVHVVEHDDDLGVGRGNGLGDVPERCDGHMVDHVAQHRRELLRETPRVVVLVIAVDPGDDDVAETVRPRRQRCGLAVAGTSRHQQDAGVGDPVEERVEPPPFDGP